MWKLGIWVFTLRFIVRNFADKHSNSDETLSKSLFWQNHTIDTCRYINENKFCSPSHLTNLAKFWPTVDLEYHAKNKSCQKNEKNDKTSHVCSTIFLNLISGRDFAANAPASLISLPWNPSSTLSVIISRSAWTLSFSALANSNCNRSLSMSLESSRLQLEPPFW